MEDEFVLGHDVDEVRADIEGGAEQMGVGFEVFITRGVILRIALRHFGIGN